MSVAERGGWRSGCSIHGGGHPVEEVVGYSMMSAAVEGKPRRDIAWMTFMENTTASPLSLV